MSATLELTVSSLRAVARDVIAVELRGSSGQVLPTAKAGSHVELSLPNGLKRHYSLVNATGQSNMTSYIIAVGWDSQSRGGSVWIHERLKVGQKLSVGLPRNLFEMDDAHRHVLLVAGGIGITPIYAMAQACQLEGRSYELWVAARSASRMAYLDELKALVGEKLHTHFDDEQGGPLHLQVLLENQNWDAVYACGPTPMLDKLTAVTAHWTPNSVCIERFKGPEITHEQNGSFELCLQRSGLETTVDFKESVLEAMERIGVEYPWSCREGVCGTCEAVVIEGTVNHKDLVLLPQERAEQKRMMVCVSRCAGKRLVLDI